MPDRTGILVTEKANILEKSSAVGVREREGELAPQALIVETLPILSEAVTVQAGVEK